LQTFLFQRSEFSAGNSPASIYTVACAVSS
jgi:hypothetical protein